MDERLLLEVLFLCPMVEHFSVKDESFIEFYEGVDCSFPANHANGVFAIDGLPLDEEKGGEAQVDLGSV